mgnify:CR=1 FL=1
MMPNMTGSIPRAVINGSSTGVMITIAGVISMNRPMNSSMTLTMIRAVIGLSVRFIRYTATVWGICENVRIHENSVADAMMNSTPTVTSNVCRMTEGSSIFLLTLPVSAFPAPSSDSWFPGIAFLSQSTTALSPFLT